MLEALERKYRNLEVKKPETVTKSTVEACQIPPVIVNNGVEVASQGLPLVRYADKFWYVTQRKVSGLVGLVAKAVENANQWMRQQFGCDMAVDANWLECQM